jgi:hypothetical protein
MHSAGCIKVNVDSEATSDRTGKGIQEEESQKIYKVNV